MLRERLRTMDLRITELADYLQISRPTMYKFIEYYDTNEFELINKKVLKLFNYINENELAGKKSVINYILNNFVEVKELNNDQDSEIIKVIKKFVISNSDSKKSQFIVACATTNYYDDIIGYLIDVLPLIKKKRLSKEEKEKLQTYINFKESLNKGEEE